jgi:hypothetical protein
MSENTHDDPPHMEDHMTPQPNIPMDPQLQQAMAALLQAMTTQFQLGNPQAPAVPAPRRNPVAAPQSHTKIRNPDPYDRSDPTMLWQFLSQCKLVFRSCPEDYQSDSVKINYAVSWLKGTAQQWYEPTLDLDKFNLPPIATHWDNFEEALKTTFGEPDPAAAASHKLDNLTIKDHHHLAKYNVDFNKYTTLTGFDKRALYAKYYKGLAPCLKDALIYSVCPGTLAELCTQAQAFNLRYWEHRKEECLKSYSAPAPKSSGTTSSTTSSPRPQPLSSKLPSRASTPSASAPKVKKPNISKNLSPNGKLLPEEKERCRKNNLCMICASNKHFLDDCPLRKPQAKAALLDPVAEDQGEGSASKAESSELPN